MNQLTHLRILLIIGAIIVALTVQLTTAQAVAAVPANLVGTWSTGPGAILTGPGFINIKNNTFITPPITGLSYSFGANGSFEEAIYIQPTNASYPGCVTSTMFWQHGKFTYFTGNRSIITSPVAADGRLGLYNPCIPSENGLAQFYYQPGL
ncbi:hypothetical protein BZG36_02905 [Bifiguratus adelaidae]|uniref:Protein ROT1 n=1 Tax=Bifiguratus adelaidae TaxID=1938954 RepID=A0A261Y1C6_9FUNG|nr:hypothetical protein BZG36_02905 [Bifiguratus adelaidae]